MTETQLLLSKISALRQRLEQAQGLAQEAESAAGANRVALLGRQVAAGRDHDALLDSSLRQLGDSPAAPARLGLLTSRARRLLERGRDLLSALRGLGDRLSPDTAAEPLTAHYRDTAALTDTTLRLVQAFPESPSAQMRLCEGMEVVLDAVGQRVATLTAVLDRRRREEERIETLAGLLTALHAEEGLDPRPFAALAEEVVAEAADAAPLRFLHADYARPARAVAAHSLTAAQVIARVVRLDPLLRARPADAVLAALVHDVGMLALPADLLGQPTRLGDDQRRLVEDHPRGGAALCGRLLPGASWLADAVACHHERLDGTGYPDGRREPQLPPLARLLAVCDAYAALAAPRPHRPAREPRAAMTETLLLAEQGALDRQQAERLLHLSFYPAGTVVELADGAVGVVVAGPRGDRAAAAPARPVVMLLLDGQGRPPAVPEWVDLSVCEGRSIVHTLSAAERRDLLGRRYPEMAA
jgi:HD-GYP domain-containing protein (c-di-GMP phosphodiesterase class II)